RPRDGGQGDGATREVVELSRVDDPSFHPEVLELPHAEVPVAGPSPAIEPDPPIGLREAPDPGRKRLPTTVHSEPRPPSQVLRADPAEEPRLAFADDLERGVVRVGDEPDRGPPPRSGRPEDEVAERIGADPETGVPADGGRFP